jgi:hypothetical protein
MRVRAPATMIGFRRPPTLPQHAADYRRAVLVFSQQNHIAALDLQIC